jgi:hypothetical protein
LIGLLDARGKEKARLKGIEKGSQCPWRRKNGLEGNRNSESKHSGVSWYNLVKLRNVKFGCFETN